MRFDVFHNFAGTLELGLAFEAYARSNGDFRDAVLVFDVFEQTLSFAFAYDRRQTLGMRKGEESQHHACIDRAQAALQAPRGLAHL